MITQTVEHRLDFLQDIDEGIYNFTVLDATVDVRAVDMTHVPDSFIAFVGTTQLHAPSPTPWARYAPVCTT